jgi:hypothetical protein
VRPPILFLLRTWPSKHRGLILVTLAALAVRLWWNLLVHRPTDFAFSDMGGYLDRGALVVDEPWRRDPSLALYPYGTHLFIGALRWIFGRRNDASIGVGFAVTGALAVAYTQATAARFLTRAWARRLSGVLLVVYYPWISLGGYALSEIPFALCVAASAFYGLRLADEGRRGDAFRLGLALGVGATVRPQILVAAVLLGLFFLLRRRPWPRFRRGLAVRALAPLGIVLVLSAYRLHVHTGGWGLVSTNGPLNFVFGRCHNIALDAIAPNRHGFFGPPSLGSLLHHEKIARAGHLGRPFFTLDPALGERLVIQGYMWDAEPNYALARKCVAATGVLRQLSYAATHVVLLWGYNSIWPDMGSQVWGPAMNAACIVHNVVFVWALVVALLLSLQRRRARFRLLSLHVVSLAVTSVLYFGDTRYRAPYDGVIVILALQGYVEAGTWLQGWRERRHWRSAVRRARDRSAKIERGDAFPHLPRSAS